MSLEVEVLVDGGPLFVGPVLKKDGSRVSGLYWIWLKGTDSKIGPFFAEISLAEKAMKKLLKKFKPSFFEQPLEWISRQKAFEEWGADHIGKPGDLIGAEWRKD